MTSANSGIPVFYLKWIDEHQIERLSLQRHTANDRIGCCIDDCQSANFMVFARVGYVQFRLIFIEN